MEGLKEGVVFYSLTTLLLPLLLFYSLCYSSNFLYYSSTPCTTLLLRLLLFYCVYYSSTASTALLLPLRLFYCLYYSSTPAASPSELRGLNPNFPVTASTVRIEPILENTTSKKKTGNAILSPEAVPGP